MKKTLSLLLALIMAFGVAVIATAGNGDPDIIVTGYDINISDELTDATTVLLINEKGKITEEKYPGVRACITVETNEQVKINEFLCNSDDGEIQIVFTLPVNYATPATVITTEPETEPEITEPETEPDPEPEETTVIIPLTVEETEPATEPEPVVTPEPEEEETSVIVPVPVNEPEPTTVILPEPEPETVPAAAPETTPAPEPTVPSTVPTSIKEGSAGGAKDGSGKIGGGSSSSGGKIARPTTKAAVEEKEVEAEEETVVIVPQSVTAIPYTGSGKMTKVIAVVVALCAASGAAYYCTAKKDD